MLTKDETSKLPCHLSALSAFQINIQFWTAPKLNAASHTAQAPSWSVIMWPDTAGFLGARAQWPVAPQAPSHEEGQT